ncbi:cytochrome P450 [Amanita rubescens]|nr:cytochrome P450 [Amanita rubescens]
MNLPTYIGNIAVVAPLALLGLTLVTVLYRRARRQHGLPPSPPPYLLFGNTYQIPSSEPWKAYENWSRIYGDPLIHLRVSGASTIVINSACAVIDLLDTRSNIYSDRPRSHSSSSSSVPLHNNPVSMTSCLLRPLAWIFSSWNSRAILGDRPTLFSTSVVHPRFKKYRKLLQTSLNPRAVEKYRTLMEQERLVMLRSMLRHPADFFQHVRRNAGAVIFNITYGWQVTSNDDYFVCLVEEALSILSMIDINKSSGWLTTFFPILQFLPSSNAHKRRASFLRNRIWCIDNLPYLWAKEQIESGNFMESFISKHLRPDDGHAIDAKEEDIVKWASGAMCFGGAETAVASVLSFILLMTLYPDIQKRAQDEIDSVLGKDRLPTFEDQDEFVYVGALIKEVLRFAPAAPLGALLHVRYAARSSNEQLGLPHRVMEEDAYMGYRIPQGATVIANIWAIAHDEEIFNRPFDFDPNRFLPSDNQRKAQMDPRKLVFGYGRRVCPGKERSFAEVLVYLSITGILATFNISKEVQEDGLEITPKLEFTTGITSHPKPFICRIQPRRAFHV